jgi:hypothetical protein
VATFEEIKESIMSLAENDQSIDDVAMETWIKQAINRINVALSSKIPTTIIASQEPLFDERFHEALVLFGVAKYRESDSSYNDAQYFMGQFDDMVRVMQRDMELLPSTRMDYNHRQIVVTNNTIMSYTMDIPYGSYFDSITVYQNDKQVDPNYYSTSLQNGTLTFKGITLANGDKITIKFENNSDLNEPPYSWWTF